MNKRVIIIGGGISGLAAAVHLKSKALHAGKDIQILLLEKSDRAGGKIITERKGDFLIEGGPDCFLPEKYWTVQLARLLGLEKEMLPSNEQWKGTFIYSNDRLHQLPEGVMLMVPTMLWPMVKSRLISWPGKLRMGLDVFIPRKERMGDESLADFVTRRLGRECLEKIAEPLVAGIHTSDPDNMSVLATFPRFIQMEQKSRSLILGMISALKNAPKPAPPSPGMPKITFFMSFVQGMQQLTDACAAYIGHDSIRFNAGVQAIEPKGKGYLIHLEGGEQLEGEAVMLATAAYEAAEMIKGLDPDMTRHMKAINWSSSANISLVFRKEDLKVQPKGFGFIVPKVENKRRINAATWSSIKWLHRAPDDYLLVRGFVGGGHHEELVHKLDDRDLLNAVLEELSIIAGLKAGPKMYQIYRWFKAMPKYIVGHPARMEELDKVVVKHPGLYLIGCSYKGIGIGECIHHAELAAENFIETL
ncbi:MAG: protoporphyrinogen oxidase [Candidatus Tectomicrobia bacterium]|uniref:Coproporphyrinogen III oxidase n=1 Tax=Tectimicrobiota bacterium TaxID=2528274 RepID=A0A933LQE2_UNCTE|nr:protoporphyrinogen oxidase [Candidatus Tectomicrobia bacterium]